METSTTPEASQHKPGTPGCSPSLESPSKTPEEENIPSEFENASLDDMKKIIKEKWQQIEDIKQAIREVDEPEYDDSQLIVFADKLQECNERKESIHKVMESIAAHLKKSVKEVYEEFGMKDED